MTSVLDLGGEDSQKTTKSQKQRTQQQMDQSNSQEHLGQEVSNVNSSQSLQGIKQYEYAGFWLRFIAFIIDGFVLLGFYMALWFVFGLLGLGEILETIVKNERLDNLLTIIVGWSYYSIMESSSKQATLGKQAMGIEVTDENGQRVTLSKASIRHFSKILSFLTFLIGYIMIAFTEKKQGLHDLIAQCLVVRKGTGKTVAEVVKAEQVEEKLY